MTRYVKKRIPVEAVEFNPARDGLEDAHAKLEEFASGYIDIVDTEDWENPEVRELAVYDTLHNTWVTFYEGHWIVKGIRGEFYPVEASVFEETYEEYHD